MMKSSHKAYDFKVHVRHQEREEDPSVAPLYRGIFSVTLNDFVEVMFIPSFSRDTENWSLNIADDVEDVRSLSEARQFTAALSEYTVTPSDERAGEQELIPLAPPLPPLRREPGDPTTGVMFYVTQKEFIRFSQELALIEEHTFLLNEYLPFSEAKEFECIQLILNHIVTSPHFAEKDSKIVNLPWYQRRFAPHTVVFNKIERLVPDEDKQKEDLPRQAALQRV
ncbi:MAG: hypothetical protein ACPGWR_09950 [Ardenticatenaceae bacterium]